MTVIAVCQLAPVVGARDHNLTVVEAAVRAAAGAGGRIVVVPELADSGYVFSDSDEARSLAQPAGSSEALSSWTRLADELDLVIVGGWCELGADGRLHNSAAIVGADGPLATYRKVHLWDRETLIFTAGDRPPPVVGTDRGRISVCVCYDLEFPEWPGMAARAGAQLQAVPVNWPLLPRPDDQLPVEAIKAQAAAAVNGMAVAVAARCGPERGVSWIGGSMIAGPDGYLLAEPLLGDTSAVLAADVDLDAADSKAIGERNDLLADRRPDLYR